MKPCGDILLSFIKPWVIHPAGQQPVYFDYNSVGDNTSVYSSVADDWERTYTYDRLGRRLTYVEGELAESLTYDASDQLTAATETQHQGYQLAVSYGNWGKISSYSLAQADLQNIPARVRMRFLRWQWRTGSSDRTSRTPQPAGRWCLFRCRCLGRCGCKCLLLTGGFFTAANMRLRRANPCCRWIWPDTPPESITTAWNTKGRGR